MKKIILLLLAFLIVFTGVMPVYALESGLISFSIEPICPDQKDKFLGINVELDDTYSNSTMLVAFYMNGKLTKLTPYDVSSKKEFTFDPTLTRDKKATPNLFQQETLIYTYSTIKSPSGNYFKDLTPDEIKIFIWDKTTLKPKTLCDNVLTPDVIKAANADVVESLSIIPEATERIRNRFLVWPEDVEDGLAETWDEHLFAIMDHLDACAEQATEDAETHLMTSLYAQSQYYDDLSQVRKLANNLTAQEQQTMDDLLSGSLNPVDFPTKYYNALNYAMKFLDFSLSDIYS